MNIAELVYESLIGELVDPVDDVPNAFFPGSYCETRYREMLDAYERLRDRLGVVDEDEDVEVVIDSLLDIQRQLCLKMFELAGIVLQNSFLHNMGESTIIYKSANKEENGDTR